MTLCLYVPDDTMLPCASSASGTFDQAARLVLMSRVSDSWGAAMPKDELRDRRVPVMLNDQEFAAIDDYRFRNRIETRSEALRELVRRGLEASSGGGREKPQKP